MIKILHYRGAKYLRIASLSLGAVTFGLYGWYISNPICYSGWVAPSLWERLVVTSITAGIGVFTVYAFIVIATLVFVHIPEKIRAWSQKLGHDISKYILAVICVCLSLVSSLAF